MGMEDTLDLREYIEIIRKRFWILIVITVVMTLVSGIISYYVLDPVYETSTTLMVNKAKNDQNSVINYQDVMLNQKLVLTYGEIVKSRAVLEKVIHTLKLNTTYEELSSKITVFPVKDTEIMNIKVLEKNPKLAAKIANEVPKIFTQEVIRITKADSVQVIDEARIPTTPIKPKKVLNIVIAAFLGIITSLFFIFLTEYLDNTIKTPEDIEKHVQLPVIGVIPLFEDVKE